VAASPPRIVVAGLSGDGGKTVVSLAILRALGERGGARRAFKKGPDYIDAAWLTWAAGGPARNLDTYLMGGDVVRRSFLQHAIDDGLNLVEGNRGLFDGFDARGTHSTAELAKLLVAPVLVVVSCEKVTRTAAALVLGCQRMDPALKIAGVVLNRVGSRRHESVLRTAIEETCGVPVVGVVPRLGGDGLVAMRHLGLVTPAEHGALAGEELSARLRAVAAGIDLERVRAIATVAGPMAGDGAAAPAPALPDGRGLTVGVVRDAAFNFYYAENLELLERSGARVVEIAALAAAALPPGLDALYIGGGFPETHAARLAANAGFLRSLRAAAAGGLPIYAECGGLMLLSEFIRWQGAEHRMAGVLPFGVEMVERPQGHGYTEIEVDAENPFYAPGTRLRGHEFHYSKIVVGGALRTACAVQRGAGCGGGRDGVVVNRVWASYTHLHALATPEFVAGVIWAARGWRDGR
jgi:cobyrinic acid a,c-diamide synthase